MNQNTNKVVILEDEMIRNKSFPSPQWLLFITLETALLDLSYLPLCVPISQLRAKVHSRSSMFTVHKKNLDSLLFLLKHTASIARIWTL